MLKEALQYIVGLGEAKTQVIAGETYTDKKLERVIYNPRAEPIRMSTLTSLLEYIKSGIDTMRPKMLVHVVSPTKVKLYSMLDHERMREEMAEAVADIPDFLFGRFMDQENFCIGLQSQFVSGDDLALVLKFAGTVEDGTVAEYGDDGVTQKATVKTGIASKTDAVIPNPVKLKPFRTFTEVEQPASNFVFRMRSSQGVQCALFEADGGAWKNEATRRIKEYLQEELKELDRYIVIS